MTERYCLSLNILILTELREIVKKKISGNMLSGEKNNLLS